MRNRTLYLIIGLTLAAGLSVWLPLPYIVRLTAATLLAVLLPGWLVLQLARVTSDTILEHLALAVGTGYSLTVVGSLGLLYAAGYVSTSWLVGLLTGLSLILAVGCLWRAKAIRSERVDAPRWPIGWELLLFTLPIAVAAFFSLTNLGYSDYWGDEMNGLLRAVSIIEGRPETLFEHTKGPVEVLLPAVFGLLAGRFETFTVRFPFALAHVVGVGGLYFLGRHMFNRQVGVLAAVILALNGLYLAFGRILQYQAVVFLMTTLALLLAYHFYQHGRGIDLVLSGLFAGVGLLAHYDTLLVLPPIAYLVWQRYRQSNATWQESWPWPVAAALVLIGVAALFYVPFLLHPHLGETSSYLARVIGAADWPGNNFDELYLFAVMYNSRYYVLFITLLGLGVIAAGLIRFFRQEPLNRRFWLVVGAALGLSLLAVAGWLTFIPVLVFSLLFVLLAGFTPASTELKTVYIWIGVSFVGYVFFIDHPRTHLQIIYPGWSLLAALALDWLATKIGERFTGQQRRWLSAGAITGLVLLLGFFAAYEYLLFADAGREYILTYPEHKRSIYWEDAQFPFGSRRLYGAPHRLGWQMIHHDFAQGELQGDWDSNDEGSNLFWYTLGAQRNPCYPRYYFLTQFQQREDDDTQSPSFNETDYVHIRQIWNADRLQIDVFEFAPLDRDREMIIEAEPARYETVVEPDDFYSLPFEDTQPRIAQSLAEPVLFQPSSGALDQIAAHYSDPRIVQVQDTIALLGYDLDDAWAVPGGLVVVTFFWQAEEAVNLPYKIFTHLISTEDDSAQLWAQADDFPACGTQSTQHWQVGEVVMDRHVLRLPADIPPGVYNLDVGLYEPQTGLRMDKLDVMGNPQGNSVEIGEVTVRPAG